MPAGTAVAGDEERLIEGLAKQIGVGATVFDRTRMCA